MANNRKSLSLLDMPPEITQYIGSFIQNKNDKATHAILCKASNHFFQPDLDKLALEQLLQAVVDDDRDTVKRILDANPALLLQEPKIKKGIESQKTWQRFHVEKPLEMALKRGQLEMVKLILPYFNELENGKKEALDQWKVRKISAQEKEQYALKMKALIDVIAKENFLNGVEGDKLINTISEETKAALEAFRKELLPDDAITLDDYVDVEQQLIAGYKAYGDHFNTFQNVLQRDLYCIGVLGFSQGVLTPELGKIFCEGLYYVCEQNKPISERAAALLLSDNDTSFYRSSRDCFSGLGFNYLIGCVGGAVAWRCGETARGGELLAVNFAKLCRAKIDEFDKLKRELKSGYLSQHEPKQQRFCMIQ